MSQSAFNLLDWFDQSWTARALEPLLWPALLIFWTRDVVPPAVSLGASILIGLFAFMFLAIALASAFMVRSIRRRRGDDRPTLQRVQDHHRDDESLLAERLALEDRPLPPPPAWLKTFIVRFGRTFSTTASRVFWGLLVVLYCLAIYNSQSPDLSVWLSRQIATIGQASPFVSRWDLAACLTILIFIYYLWLWACRTRAELEQRGTA